MVQNQQNKNIKILRTDNGGEFCNKDFEKYLMQEGIVHQKTVPYTSEQNGVCERANRTVIEKQNAYCLMLNCLKVLGGSCRYSCIHKKQIHLYNVRGQNPI